MAPQALGPRAPEPIFFPVCDRLPALQELSLAKCGVAVLGAKSLKRKDACARAVGDAEQRRRGLESARRGRGAAPAPAPGWLETQVALLSITDNIQALNGLSG